MFISNRLYWIGVVFTCILTVTICGCDIDVDDKPPTEVTLPTEVKPSLLSVSPSSGSTIDTQSEITLNFTGLPKNVSVNKGTLVTVVGGFYRIKGPFSGNELTIVVKWDGGSKTLKYSLKIKYQRSDPSAGSTLFPRDDITLYFSGNPKNVRGGVIGLPNFTVTGNTVKLTNNWWDPGILEFEIQWDGNTRVAGGKKVLRYNVFNGPIAYIDDVWVDHNEEEGIIFRTKGMRIHVKFTVGNMRNENGSVIAYFQYANGNPLEDHNNKFRTVDGDVSTSKEFKPRFDTSTYKDLHFFMPYSELHMAKGKWDLRFKIQIHNQDRGKFIERESKYVYFTYTKG